MRFPDPAPCGVWPQFFRPVVVGVRQQQGCVVVAGICGSCGTAAGCAPAPEVGRAADAADWRGPTRPAPLLQPGRCRQTTAGQKELGFDEKVIRLQQGWKVKDRIQGIYDRHDFLEERKLFMVAWCDALLAQGMKA